MTATPPRADLRTLAAEAIRDGDHALADDGECGRPEDQLAVVDAVLAAVLPEHRRTVLGEAEAAIEDARSGWPDGHTVTIGYDEAIEVVRRLAAAAPPAGLSAPVPVEPAPAVPEEAGGQRAGEGPYRVGRKVGRTIYRMAGNEPSDADELIGVMDSPALAAFAVRGMNAETRGGRVPLADVLDALRDDDGFHRWRKALTGVRPEYPPLTTRHHLADYLAERFALTTAPEGADERNGHGHG